MTKEDTFFDLERFVQAQEFNYQEALQELKDGQKKTHWMWYIFPQLSDLGRSTTAKYYGIKSLEEAKAYLTHEVLGPRLYETVAAILSVNGKAVYDIMGYPDNLKLKSSMTLFAQAVSSPSPFEEVLDKYYEGEKDQQTLDILLS